MTATTANTLALATAAAPLTFTDEQKATMLATVAKGCTQEEFALLLQLAQNYNLDPFAKEIWAIKLKAGEAALIMTSRDGYLRIAQRDPSYQGLASAVVRKGDHFAFDAAKGTVEHSFGAERGEIIGAWAIAHHRMRLPQVAFVDFKEYRGTSPVWAKYPSAMIQKVAEVFVLKRQFGINGLVTREEMDAGAIDVEVIQAAPDAPADTNAPAAPIRDRGRVVDADTGEVLQDGPPLPPAPPSRQDQVKAELKLAGKTRADYDALLASLYPERTLSSLSVDEFVDLLDAIKAKK